MKTKNKLKLYYIVKWKKDCWNSFIQHQIDICKCYKLKEGYINIFDYREDDSYYAVYPREEFYFKWNIKDVFTDLEKAKKYAIEKIEEMYLSRCKHLIRERDEAIRQTNASK